MEVLLLHLVTVPSIYLLNSHDQDPEEKKKWWEMWASLMEFTSGAGGES